MGSSVRVFAVAALVCAAAAGVTAPTLAAEQASSPAQAASAPPEAQPPSEAPPSPGGQPFSPPAIAAQIRFEPNKLGSPTSLAVSAVFKSATPGPPPPISKLTFYAPRGMRIDPRGAGVCTAAILEARGPYGCPADSRVGFGDGIGLFPIAAEVLHAHFTLDFFFAPRQEGRIVLLVYVQANSPAQLELVLQARQVSAPKPYGLGFEVNVPPITVLPDAPNASVERVSFTVGASNAAFYKHVHGKRRLVHVLGIVEPQHCPKGGFRAEAIMQFAEGPQLTINPTLPCPRLHS